MKVLLIGEYSRLHNSLKEGLTALGHDVAIVGTGDNFKKYNVDYSIYPKTTLDIWIIKKIKNALYKFTGLNLEKTERGIRFYFLLAKLKGFDHVQLINSDAIETYVNWTTWLYKKLFLKNGSKSLLVCGDETTIIDYYLKNELKYSILTPYLKNKKLKKQFDYSLKYTTDNYRKLFTWLSKNCSSIIASDFDYKIPMENMGYNIKFIPNPININQLEFKELIITDKIIIFSGINRLSYIKKGISFFEEALEIIQQKYPDKIEIIISENVPYNEYIQLYNKAHIVLDQIYAYDQGYNALEAMAKGKVVFTGVENEVINYYNLKERVAINALPDVDFLVSELSFLIENPEEIIAIGKRARLFIEKEHNYIEIAKKYVEAWKNNI